MYHEILHSELVGVCLKGNSVFVATMWHIFKTGTYYWGFSKFNELSCISSSLP